MPVLHTLFIRNMPKYRVKEGNHVEGGRTYTKGQIVDSPVDLAELFKGKFEKVSDPEPAPTSTAAPAPPAAKPKKKKKGAAKADEWGEND